MQESNYKKNNSNKNLEVKWNASNLFYIFLNELDLDYKEAYYSGDWERMYKVFKLKYMKVKSFIEKKMLESDKEILEDDKTISLKLSKIKSGDNDFSNRWNSSIIEEILTIIEKKMIIIDRLMSESGMYLLLEKLFTERPGALGNDDFFLDKNG